MHFSTQLNSIRIKNPNFNRSKNPEKLGDNLNTKFKILLPFMHTLTTLSNAK